MRCLELVIDLVEPKELKEPELGRVVVSRQAETCYQGMS